MSHTTSHVIYQQLCCHHTTGTSEAEQAAHVDRKSVSHGAGMHTCVCRQGAHVSPPPSTRRLCPQAAGLCWRVADSWDGVAALSCYTGDAHLLHTDTEQVSEGQTVSLGFFPLANSVFSNDIVFGNCMVRIIVKILVLHIALWLILCVHLTRLKDAW